MRADDDEEGKGLGGGGGEVERREKGSCFPFIFQYLSVVLASFLGFPATFGD